MATGQLGLYNVALRAIGERSLDALTDSGEPRRELDAVWSTGNGALRFLLEQGFWNFAIRTQMLDHSASATPAFGLTYAFERPSDMVRLLDISADERFSLPLNEYESEAGYFFAEVTPLYLRFVSDDGSYGADYSRWPETFTLWAGHWLALQIAPRLTSVIDTEKLEAKTRRLLVDARSKDAQEEPTRFPQHGSWVQARWGRHSGGSRDRSKGANLIG